MISSPTFTILLIDDIPENLLSLEEILSRDGREFKTAGSGNEGLKLALKHQEIGLIMLDVQMPGMDGFEVARLLKSNQKTRDISIIFVTAISKNEQNVLKGFEEGAVDYLQKPLDINITRAKVNVFEQLYFYQQNLKSTLAELALINKQLERFVYMVSHDLKAPLASILLLLDMMKHNEQYQEPKSLVTNIGMLSNAAGYLAGMISSILDYSRKSITEQVNEEVNTYELVSHVIAMLFPPKHISIEILPGLPTIFTCKIKLQQVIQNLVTNAIKYMDKPQGRIVIGAEDKEAWYEFYVKDNGPGIGEADQDKIFKLFATTSNVSSTDSSTGIGLNLLKMMVEEQGGRIWVTSTPGEGSEFRFEWKK